jgi:cell division protein FtsL
MSRFLTITNSNSAQVGIKKKAINSKEVKVGKITLNFILVVLICAAGIFYIYEVNRLAVRGYQVGDLEEKIKDLKEENERIKIKAAEIKSMYRIEEDTKGLNMVAPQDVSYIQLPGEMALNK